MDKSDFTEERKADLFEAFHRNLKESKSVKEAITHTVNSPAKKFYVSTEEAKRIYSKIMNGCPIDRISEEFQEMYREVVVRSLRYKLEHIEKPIGEIIEEIIEQPAPKFYLKPGSARSMIYDHIKHRKRRMI